MIWDICAGTTIEPDTGKTEYWQPAPQLGVPAVDQEYVPDATLGIEMLLEVLVTVAPLKVTLQEVPGNSPDSEKVTV